MLLHSVLLLLTSLELLHGFASNCLLMFLGWTPTKFVKIRVLLLFFMELWVILYNFWPILKKSKTTNQKSFIFGLESPQGTLFLVCSNKVAVTYIYDLN